MVLNVGKEGQKSLCPRVWVDVGKNVCMFLYVYFSCLTSHTCVVACKRGYLESDRKPFLVNWYFRNYTRGPDQPHSAQKRK